MKTLYLDIFSGISGDMFIGALLDLGVEFQDLERELRKLGVHGYHLRSSLGHKGAIAGVKFDVHLEDHGHDQHHDDEHHDHGHADDEHHHDEHHHDHDLSHKQGPHSHGHGRTFAEIRELIQRSSLSEWVKARSVSVFHRIAVAEGAIHGQPPEEVHFHEVGAVDSIVDIVGACVGLELLGRPAVLASEVTEGTGWIECAHGRFPIPAPATLGILSQRAVRVTQCAEPHELVTPTGAAILAEFAESFAPMRNLAMNRVGYGLGTRNNQTRPNVLRAILSDSALESAKNDWETDRIGILETNLDDVNPEILGCFMERALAAGALEVFHTPIQMKKNRPGILLTVLCAEEAMDLFTELMLRETTALGVRRTVMERRKLQREMTTVETRYGEVAVKLGKLNGRVIQASPEFESCKALAAETQIPLKDIYNAASNVIATYATPLS